MLFTLPNLFYFILTILTIFFSKIRNIVTEFYLFIFRILAKFGTQYYANIQREGRMGLPWCFQRKLQWLGIGSIPPTPNEAENDTKFNN
jgi:hypothetical protein